MFYYYLMQEVTPTTEYVWSWGDGSKSVATGTITHNHTYSQPGLYGISVNATEGNETFSSILRSTLVSGNKRTLEIHLYVMVFFSDKISRLIISRTSSLVVAGVTVTFTARVELQYGTTYFTPVTYQWSYSDGGDSGPIHVFSEPGTYQVNCTAMNYVINFSNSTLVTVREGSYVASQRISH